MSRKRREQKEAQLELRERLRLAALGNDPAATLQAVTQGFWNYKTEEFVAPKDGPNVSSEPDFWAEFLPQTTYAQSLFRTCLRNEMGCADAATRVLLSPAS